MLEEITICAEAQGEVMIDYKVYRIRFSDLMIGSDLT